MGVPRWKSDEWDTYKVRHIDKKESPEELYTAGKIDKDLDPMNIKMRESCDSASNPNSTPIVICGDVTGSMGSLAEAIVRTGIKTIATEVHKRKTILDPHILFMGIGDVEEGDKAPLQVTQFEADIKIIEQLQKVYLEGHGGSNRYESYALAWYFAATHTRIDSFEKRNKKGLLFTIGDEFPTPYLTAKDIKKVTGDIIQKDKLTGEEILTMVSRQYEVFHIIVEEGNCFRMHGDEVTKEWKDILGQNVINLSDHTKIGEVVVSVIQRYAGEKEEEVIGSWDKSTAVVVKKAISSLSSSPKDTGSTGIVKF